MRLESPLASVEYAANVFFVEVHPSAEAATVQVPVPETTVKVQTVADVPTLAILNVLAPLRLATENLTVVADG